MDFGLAFVPGEGVRGLLNVWESPVDIAGEGMSRAGGETWVLASGVRRKEGEEKLRGCVRTALRIQVRQIMVVVLLLICIWSSRLETF